MANETVANLQSTMFENGRWVYRRGFVNGGDGDQLAAIDRLHILIPQMVALTTVVADAEWSWNGETRQQLLYLAQGIAEEINEGLEEHFCDLANARSEQRARPEAERAS